MGLDPEEKWARNLDLFVKMKHLAEQQMEFVEKDDMERFLHLTSMRDRLQQEISKNDRAPEALVTEKNPRGTGRNKTELTREISEIIRSIQDTDRKIERFIQEKKNLLLSDIRTLRHGHKAMKGYGGTKAPTIPKFIDRKG